MKKMLSATLFLNLGLGLVTFASAPALAQEQEEYQCPNYVERHHHQDLHLSFCNSELYKTEGSGAGMNCYYHGYVCDTEYKYDWADVAGWL